MSAALVSLIVQLVGVAVANGPAAVAAIMALFAQHAQESPAESAQIIMALATTNHALLQQIRDAAASIDTSKPPAV